MPSYSSYQATVAHYRKAELHRRFHLNPMNLLAPLPEISLESSPSPSSSNAAPLSPPPPRPVPLPPSSADAALGSSLVFSSSSQSALLLPPSQDGPPLLFPGQASGHKVAAAVGGGQEKQQPLIMIGPNGDASLTDSTTEDEDEDLQATLTGASSAASSQVASATSQVASTTARPSTSAAFSSPATTSLPPPTTSSPPRTTTRVQPTTLTTTVVSTSIQSASTSVVTSLLLSTASGTPTTVISTLSPSAASSSLSLSSLSASSSIPLASTTLLAGLAHTSISSSTSSSIPSSSVTALSSNANTSQHSKAPLIIIASLSALVLVATLATSLSWLIRTRHSRDSFWSFCCCFAARRRSSASSDVSYEHDDQSDFYEAYGPEASSVRRAGDESQLRTEKFYGMPGNSTSGMGRSTSLDGGSEDAGGMERRRSIKRGIAESELEDGFNLHDAQTLGDSQALGRRDSTFLDPANGRHLTPALPPMGSPIAAAAAQRAASTNSKSSVLSSPRNPFAIPALMTPTPEVVSSLSGDSPYPTSRPLPGSLVVANYVRGDITDVEGSSHRSPTRASIAASGYETDVATGKIGTPRLGDISTPRFLSLGEEGGLEVPWHQTGSPSDVPYSHSSSSSFSGSIPTPPHESALPSLSRPSPFLSQDPFITPPPPAHVPTHISQPTYNPSYAAPASTPFPDATGNPTTDTWAATLRTNLFAAISNMTGAGAGPALDPEKGLGMSEKGEMDKYTAFPAGADGFGRRKSLKEAGGDFPSPFSRSSSNASSVPSRYGSNLHHTPSVASSLYSTTTAASEQHPSTTRPKRLRGKKIIANGTPAPSSMGVGGLRMATEEASSDDGSTWNGLGGKSDNEAWEKGGRMA